MDNEQFIPYTEVKRSFKISNSTHKKWEAAGIVNTVRLPGGKRLYSKSGIAKCFNLPLKERSKFIYARVSSPHQKHDLDRQVDELKIAYPEYTVLCDIASGLNWKRKGFKALLEHILEGNCEEVVVSHRDRLCRFGFELVEWLAQKHNCTIVVHSQSMDVQDDAFGNTELADDLLAVVTFFTARNNGMRAATNKRRRKESAQDTPQVDNETEIVDQHLA